MQRVLKGTLVDGILKYNISPEKEDYTITETDPFAMDIDPQLLGEGEFSTNTRPRSNLRLFPPPLFSRQGVPQNYKYVRKRLGFFCSADVDNQL